MSPVIVAATTLSECHNDQSRAIDLCDDIAKLTSCEEVRENYSGAATLLRSGEVGANICHRVRVFLGSNEWGNEKMRKAADEVAHSLKSRPLAVTVYEHGGWSLSFWYHQDFEKGIIIGSANDAARWDDRQLRAQEIVMKSRIEWHKEVRR